MKNLRRFTLLFLAFVIFLSSGCTSPATRAPAPASVDATQATAQSPAPVDVSSEVEEVESVAQIVDGPLTPVEIRYPSLGSIAFELDSSATATAEYFPERETVLELTDAAGLTWTLTVPIYALETPQTLTMTALANTRSQDVPGSLSGGLLLEPDGLRFNMPATLTVSGSDAAGLPFVLTGKNDGTAITVANMEKPGVGSIDHFSTVYMSRVEQEQVMEEMYKKLNESEKALFQQARELLKNPNIAVPVPPSIPLECTSEADAKVYAEQLKEFLTEVYKPEGDLINKLIAIKRGKALLGRETEVVFTLENRLLSRMVKKVRLLIKTYQGQEEKLNAVSTLAMKVAKEVQLLSEEPGGDVLFAEEIRAWAESLIDKMVEEIRTQHNYRKVSAVWKMAYWASLLGSQRSWAEEIEAKLERVLQFLMKLNWEMGIEGESRYVAEGEFPVRFLPKQAGMVALFGSGKAEMLSADFESDENWWVEAPPFHVEAIITGFDVCGLKANLTINRFFPREENHFTLDSEGEVMEIGPMPLMEIAWNAVYDYRKKTGPSWYEDGEASDQYTFELNLRNKDVIAVSDMDEVVQPGETGTMVSWFSVKLTHTPK